ncbi:hypothetical protein D3C79_791020 [compost metagenome]
MMRNASFMVSGSISTLRPGRKPGTVEQPWVSGPSHGSATSTQRPGANHGTPLTSRRLTWPGWTRSWARNQSSIRSSIQPWKCQNTGFTWDENGSPRKSFSAWNQRAAKSSGLRAKGTGRPLEGSRGTEAQRMCSQSCKPSSISDPNCPSVSVLR